MTWPYHVDRGNTEMRLTATYTPRRLQAHQEEKMDMRVDIRLIVSTFSGHPETRRSPPLWIEDSRLVEYVLAETFNDQVHTMVTSAISDSLGVSPEVVVFLSQEITMFALRSVSSEFIQQGDYSCKVMAEIDVHEPLVEEATSESDIGAGVGFGGVAASVEAIKAVKETTYTGADEHGTTCTVCMEDFVARQKLRVMPCEHAFHRECLDAWLKLSHVCPLCRFAIATQGAAPPPPPPEQQ